MTVGVLRQLLVDVDPEALLWLTDSTPVKGVELSASFDARGEKTSHVIMLEV